MRPGERRKQPEVDVHGLEIFGGGVGEVGDEGPQGGLPGRGDQGATWIWRAALIPASSPMAADST